MKHRYSLRQVVELTGVSEFTLRGWELRYKALRPARTETGRRLYSQDDILKARALQDLTARGHRIGAIASLPLVKLQTLLEERENAPPVDRPPSKGSAIPRSAAVPDRREAVQSAIQLADRFAWDDVEKLLIREHVKFKPTQFIHGFLIPLLREINHQVSLHQFSLAQEHIFSAMIRDSLYAIQRTSKRKTKSDKRMLFSSPEGDFHDTGLLIAATLAAVHGVPYLFLGANVPVRDLCEAGLRYGATHLVITTMISKKEGAKEDAYDWIHYLDSHADQKTALWLAGRNAQSLSLSLKRDFKLLLSFQEFEQLIKKFTPQPGGSI